MKTEVTSYLPYHEPGIITILTLSSFLLALNALNSIFDRLIYCGLLTQVFVGVAFGTPGGNILGREVEDVVVQLGYLGLILLVYEGGLATNIKSLKANLVLSSFVAITGIALPIALSFTLASLLNATPLQCFAAGAALCSTSLGTTFTILGTSGLARSKLGVVLASAAMMDDVAGLVMVQVISNLGSAASTSFSWKTVVRPLGVSVAFAVCVPLLCWMIKPLAAMTSNGWVRSLTQGQHSTFIIQTCFLLAMITGAIYAGTSGLFAAYLTGAVVSWWDGLFSTVEQEQSTAAAPDQPHERPTEIAATQTEVATSSQERDNSLRKPQIMTGLEVYERYYAAALTRVLKPFFFASIGFAIPITEMFGGQVLWRGIVYTLLMVIAKLATGFWLVRLHLSWPKDRLTPTLKQVARALMGCLNQEPTTTKGDKQHQSGRGNVESEKPPSASASSELKNSNPPAASSATESQASTAKIQKPLSLYPASMLGTAMVARGEIGFLIASVAATTGLFDGPQQSSQDSNRSPEIYLVVVWAVVLCTIIGPLSVGSLVRRVKRLEGIGIGETGRRPDGPLGVWGLD